MSRLSLATLGVLVLAGGALGATACSKSKESAQKGGSQESPALTGGVGDPPPAREIAPSGGAGPATAAPATADDARFHLQANEGTLAVTMPAGAKAGTETMAKIVVTPGADYHINVEYPTKLTVDTTAGVQLAKAVQTAGGADKAKGDADAFNERELAFAVKLTPAAPGSYTLKGSFKFAVCDKDQCLPKKELITIQVAAN